MEHVEHSPAGERKREPRQRGERSARDAQRRTPARRPHQQDRRHRGQHELLRYERPGACVQRSGCDCRTCGGKGRGDGRELDQTKLIARVWSALAIDPLATIRSVDPPTRRSQALCVPHDAPRRVRKRRGSGEPENSGANRRPERGRRPRLRTGGRLYTPSVPESPRMNECDASRMRERRGRSRSATEDERDDDTRETNRLSGRPATRASTPHPGPATAHVVRFDISGILASFEADTCCLYRSSAPLDRGVVRVGEARRVPPAAELTCEKPPHPLFPQERRVVLDLLRASASEHGATAVARRRPHRQVCDAIATVLTLGKCAKLPRLRFREPRLLEIRDASLVQHFGERVCRAETAWCDVAKRRGGRGGCARIRPSGWLR